MYVDRFRLIFPSKSGRVQRMLCCFCGSLPRPTEEQNNTGCIKKAQTEI